MKPVELHYLVGPIKMLLLEILRLLNRRVSCKEKCLFFKSPRNSYLCYIIVVIG